MALLNPFQTYTQEENSMTNNILLMLSNLYRLNPKYYQDFIQGIIEDNEQFEVIPTFRQQVGNRGDGVIDGHIQIKGSKIIIETKRSGVESIDKLIKYCKSFDTNELKILLHISTEYYSQTYIDKINSKLVEYKQVGRIYFKSLIFDDLISQLHELAKSNAFDLSLQQLLSDFKSYCEAKELTSQENNSIRAMACGQSFDLNLKFQFYFDLASRGFRGFKYLGIYKDRSVRYIGEIDNIIVANWNNIDGLQVMESKYPITTVQQNRLIQAIQGSLIEGWHVDTDHRFFLLRNLVEINFKKKTPGGIFRVRYLNLRDYLDEVPDDINLIPNELKNIGWE